LEINGTSYAVNFAAGVGNNTASPYYGIVANGSVPAPSSLIVNLYGSNIPTDGSTYNVSPLGGAGNTNPILGLGTETYTARSGSVTAHIVGGKVNITFTNMEFKGISDSTVVKTVSANVTVM
jgi:hypothetical protein